MRIVTGTELLTLSEGTIFQEYAPHYLNEPMIFRGALGDYDFVEEPLLPFSDSGGDTDSISHPWGTSRDGCYDHENRRFLVWEQADRDRVVAMIQHPETEQEEVRLVVS